ncbi:HDA1 [Candida jiufengensis]|uniref:HDA1 n=1 Tax=Candida jiufengensis TaxID=497108 RepID=UPI0022248E65|nr:HDA1 [Candida jiufengensis]KAI5950875.1 HDA1 [Candida jiufengensis]
MSELSEKAPDESREIATSDIKPEELEDNNDIDIVEKTSNLYETENNNNNNNENNNNIIEEEQPDIMMEDTNEIKIEPVPIAITDNGINIDNDSKTIDIKEENNDNFGEPPSKKLKLEESPIKNGSRPIVVAPPSKSQLFYIPLKTGLVYDVRMRYHAKIFTSYFEYTDPHPEDPRRIYRIYKKLVEAGLVSDFSLSGIDELGPYMQKIPIREATMEEILEVHSEKHLQHIKSTETMTKDELLKETAAGDSIYVNNDSYFSAKLSCGGTIEACKAVIEGKVKNSLAAVRPPGHHAEPNDPGGFCLFSNVAVAAKNILKSYPESVRRIVILDWDIHHGNGTQKAFYDDPRVLYISLHRYENGKFYPGTKYGGSDQVGEGPGEGYSLNIPWRTSGMHDGDYVYAFNKVIIPVILEFDPDLIIVSSGFDAAAGDIIGGCHVSPAGYGYMTHMLKGIAKGKMAVILEGGYNLDSISESALAVAKVLIGEPPENTINKLPHQDTIEVIDEVIKIQSKYWKCLKSGIPETSFDDVYDLPGVDAFKLTNISDPIRLYQSNQAFNKKNFINLPIDQSTFTFDCPNENDNLVIASPNIYECDSIVITIHDPPDVWANINPTNGIIESYSSVILEHPLLQIIDKIEKEKQDNNPVGYIDINIPSYPLPIPGSTYTSSYNQTIFAQEILLYIWDNYITFFNQLKNIVFVGFGDSYQSLVHLFSKRPSSEIKSLVKFTVAYINRTLLKPIVPVMDESMVDWFYQNSTIFTSCNNQCWSNVSEDLKRPRRKFGRVLKANSDGLFDVINEKFDEGVDNILDNIEEFSSSDE